MEKYIEKGQKALQIGDLKTAEVELSKAIKANPKSDDAYVLRGKTRWENKELKAALADFTKAVELNPQNSTAKLSIERLNEILSFR